MKDASLHSDYVTDDNARVFYEIFVGSFSDSNGDGVAVSQDPYPGSVVPAGSTVSVTFQSDNNAGPGPVVDESNDGIVDDGEDESE